VGQSNGDGEEFHVPMKSEKYINMSLLSILNSMTLRDNLIKAQKSSSVRAKNGP